MVSQSIIVVTAFKLNAGSLVNSSMQLQQLSHQVLLQEYDELSQNN